MKLKSECGKYVAERIEDGMGTNYHLFDATGTPLGKTTFWSNHHTTTHYRFEVGVGEHAAFFSFPRFPRWFRKRWVEIWDIEAKELLTIIRANGGVVLDYCKPDMNCWHHVGFRADSKSLNKIDRALRRRKVGFGTRQQRGQWDIHCPLKARKVRA